MIRLDLVRQAERELQEAFARGAFEQVLREWDAALARAGEGCGNWATRLLEPGLQQAAFCGKLARDWVALPDEQRESDVFAWLVRGLRAYGAQHPTPVIRLRPVKPVPRASFLRTYIQRVVASRG